MRGITAVVLLSATLLVGGCGRRPRGPADLSEDLGPPPIAGTVSAGRGLDPVQPAIADPAAFRAGRATSGASEPTLTGNPATNRLAAGAAKSSPPPRGGPVGGSPAGGGLVPPEEPPGSLGETAPNVYITAIVGRDGVLRALITDKTTGASRWAQVGDVVFGYTVRYVTLRGAVLERNGHQWVLAIGEGRPTEATASASPGAAATPEAVEGGPAPVAEPTTQERFYGRWRGSQDGQTMEITFSPGGTGRVDAVGMGESMSFKWRLAGQTLYLAMMGEDEDEIGYRFADNYRTLYIKPPDDTQEIRLTKQ